MVVSNFNASLVPRPYIPSHEEQGMVAIEQFLDCAVSVLVF